MLTLLKQWKEAALIHKSERDQEPWDDEMRAVFAQWKRRLTERPILGLKCLKTMTTSTSLTTDDTWCVSCGGSKEVLWKLSWPHFLLKPSSHTGAHNANGPWQTKLELQSNLMIHFPNLCSKWNYQRWRLTKDMLRKKCKKKKKKDTLRLDSSFINSNLISSLEKLEETCIFMFECLCTVG